MDVVFLSLTKLNLSLLNRSPPNLPVNIVVSDYGLNHTDITCCSLESHVWQSQVEILLHISIALSDVMQNIRVGLISIV